jgi:hypothetical protein
MSRILRSKRAYRQSLAARPIAEKLAMLDDLRERTESIRRAVELTRTSARENSAAQGDVE